MDRLSQLRSAQEIIAALEELLDAERRAIATMNSKALEAMNEAKEGLRDRLRFTYEILASHKRTGTDSPEITTLTLAVRTANRRMLNTASENCVLLDEVIAVVSEAMGLQLETGTYDRNANRRHSVLASDGKRA